MISPNSRTGSIADLHTQDGAGPAALHRFCRNTDRASIEPGQPAANDDAGKATSKELVAQLLDNRRAFLRYVERRVGNRASAEEIVQDAFVRSLNRGDEVRDSVLGWFYRVLRNAVIDHQRSQAVANRKLDEFAIALQGTTSGDEELVNVVCACVTQLANTLKPEYADALRRIDLDQVSVKDYAETAGISANNAGVRLFRARQALRKQVARSCGTCAEHGCFDCSCGAPRG